MDTPGGQNGIDEPSAGEHLISPETFRLDFASGGPAEGLQCQMRGFLWKSQKKSGLRIGSRVGLYLIEPVAKEFGERVATAKTCDLSSVPDPRTPPSLATAGSFETLKTLLVALVRERAAEVIRRLRHSAAPLQTEKRVSRFGERRVI